MNKKLIKRLSLDLAMTVLILLEFAYRMTGSTVHELIGLSMLTLFVIHGAWNWRWFLDLFKGRYGGLRTVSVTINTLLVATVLLMILSGVLNSDLLFLLTHVERELLPRALHTAAAYWFLILMGVHLGMHWKMIMAEARALAGMSGRSFPSRLRTISLHILSASIATYGIFASFERNVFSRLTGYYSFGNREIDEPVLGFLVQHVSIVGLYGYLTYHALQLFKSRSRSFGQSRPDACSVMRSWWCKCEPRH